MLPDLSNMTMRFALARAAWAAELTQGELVPCGPIALLPIAPSRVPFCGNAPESFTS